MGDVYADLTLRGPAGETALRLLVDTGSIYTWVPARVAHALGVRPKQVTMFYLADGSRVRRRVAEAEVEILGRSATRFVVFARETDAGVVGVDTLQGLLLYVDPTTHRLRKRTSARAITPHVVGFVEKRRAKARNRRMPSTAT